MLPTALSEEALAYTGFFRAYGPHALAGVIAVARHWRIRHGAELVASWGTMLRFIVGQPPTTVSDAFRLAHEQEVVAPCTTILPGVSLRDHARALLSRTEGSYTSARSGGRNAARLCFRLPALLATAALARRAECRIARAAALRACHGGRLLVVPRRHLAGAGADACIRPTPGAWASVSGSVCGTALVPFTSQAPRDSASRRVQYRNQSAPYGT
jgi:hypothetical protein